MKRIYRHSNAFAIGQQQNSAFTLACMASVNGVYTVSVWVFPFDVSTSFTMDIVLSYGNTP
jgi:hypothetical protein